MIDGDDDDVLTMTLDVQLSPKTDNRIRYNPDEREVTIGKYNAKGRRIARKFITFHPARYLVLRDIMEDVTTTLTQVKQGQVADMNFHLGYHIYVNVKSPYVGVSIRQWYRPGGNPTKDLLPGYGIFLKWDEWDTVVKTDITMNDFIPMLSETERCLDTHHGQLSYIACIECNPDKLHHEYL